MSDNLFTLLHQFDDVFPPLNTNVW